MVPYGYRIVDGQAVPDPVDAKNLRMMYSLYLKGFTIDDAAHDAGVPRKGSSAGSLLNNRVYLGTDFYPRLIQDDVFEKTQEERQRRARKPSITNLMYSPVPVGMAFRLNPSAEVGKASSAREATETIYSMIEPATEGISPDVYKPIADKETKNMIQVLFQTLCEQRSGLFLPKDDDP